MNKTKKQYKTIYRNVRNVVIDQKLFEYIIKDAKYGESFNEILHRKLNLTINDETDTTPEQSDVGE